MSKTHFTVTGTSPACHLSSGRTSTDTRRVTCGSCQKQASFVDAKQVAEVLAEASFWAQTPRTIKPQFARVNRDGVMECETEYGGCGGVLWREKPRSSWAFHYVCAGCGKSVQPLTETGMST